MPFSKEHIIQKSTNQKQELSVATMYVNGSKLNGKISTEDLPYMLPTNFWFIWPIGFRGEDYLEIDQSEIRISCGNHVCQRIGMK